MTPHDARMENLDLMQALGDAGYGVLRLFRHWGQWTNTVLDTVRCYAAAPAGQLVVACLKEPT